MNVSRQTIKDLLFTFLIFVLAIANASPRIALLGYSREIYFIALFLCMIITFIKIKVGSFISKDAALRFVVVFLMFIFPLVAGQSTYANRYLHLSGLLLYPLLYEATKNTKIPRYLCISLIIWSVIVAVPTITVSSQYMYASRVADHTASYQMMGVGGYMYIYAICLGSVTLFSYAINNGMSKITFGAYLLWLVFIITIYKSNFMTAVLVALVGAMCCVIFKRTSIQNKILGILLLFLVFFLFIGPVFSLIETLMIRISSGGGRIAQIFSGSDSILQALLNEFVGDRLPTLKSSIDAIREHPFLGLIGSGTDAFTFGQHSTILDTFALWGIPLAGFYIVLMLKPYFSTERRRKYEYTIPLIVSFLLLALFNNVECTSAFVIFYLGLALIDGSINKSNICEQDEVGDSDE